MVVVLLRKVSLLIGSLCCVEGLGKAILLVGLVYGYKCVVVNGGGDQRGSGLSR